MTMYLSPISRIPASAGLFADDLFRSLFSVRETRPMRVNITETDEAYLLEAELPGIRPEQIELTYSEGVLTVAASHDTAAETQQEGRRYSERAGGSFRRSFRAEGIRGEAITAASRDGILTVTLPKEEPAKPAVRRIPIGE